MKKLDELIYETPTVEIIRVEVERGFATSQGGVWNSGGPGFEDSGVNEWRN